MTTHCRFALACIVVCLVTGGSPASTRAQTTGQLTVVSAGPTEEVANLAEANEVRVVFSEPMVTLGRIPDPVRPPFFTNHAGRPRNVPMVRHDDSDLHARIPSSRCRSPRGSPSRSTPPRPPSAAASSRNPTRSPSPRRRPSCCRSNWYRRGGRADAPVVVVLRFNQPVRPADVAAHLSAGFEPHNWTEPVMPQAIQQRLTAVDPTAIGRFQAKARQTRAAASARSPVTFRLTDDWDKKAFPPEANLVAFESTTAVPSESWVKVVLDGRLPSPAGVAVPGTEQSYVVQVEPAFFINGFDCTAECDPDRRNPLHLRREVKVAAFADAVSDHRHDWLGRRKAARQVRETAPRRDFALDESRFLTIEDAGYPTQPPVRRYDVTVDANLRAADGQILGYTWLGQVENVASAILHEFRRRPRRVGDRRWKRAAVLRAELPRMSGNGRLRSAFAI